MVRRDIADGHYGPHDRLPSERAFADLYKVARGTVRDALNQLAAQGLVDIRPGSGTYVTIASTGETNPVIANASPLELVDARFALEPHICRLAVLHGRGNRFRSNGAAFGGDGGQRRRSRPFRESRYRLP